MARVFTQTLIRESRALIRDHKPAASHLLSARLVTFRRRSGRPEKLVQIFEVDLDSAPEVTTSSDAAAARGEAAARRLESVIHGVLVRHAAPDWLHFIPGSSYWVPPWRRSEGLVEFLGRGVSSPVLSEEEVMSLTTERGWPCTAHLVEDTPRDLVDRSSKNASIKSDDEDV